MASETDSQTATPGRPPVKQRRSQITYDRMLDAGLELLTERDLDSISVAMAAKAAGYSVGAFYARFKTKDEFHRAMLERYAVERIASFDALFDEVDDEDLIPAYFKHQIAKLGANQNLWRASLYRSFENPEFWEPYRGILVHVSNRLVERAARRAGRPLTDEEQTNVRFAAQVTTGAINVALMNRAGAVKIEDPSFSARLERAFRAISDWDRLGG